MSDHIVTIQYAIDRIGNTAELQLREIPYDVFKAAKSQFIDNPDKALKIIINQCGVEGREEALALIDKGSLTAITSLESGIAELITPIQATIKKK